MRFQKTFQSDFVYREENIMLKFLNRIKNLENKKRKEFEKTVLKIETMERKTLKLIEKMLKNKKEKQLILNKFSYESFIDDLYMLSHCEKDDPITFKKCFFKDAVLVVEFDYDDLSNLGIKFEKCTFNNTLVYFIYKKQNHSDYFYIKYKPNVTSNFTESRIVFETLQKASSFL